MCSLLTTTAALSLGELGPDGEVVGAAGYVRTGHDVAGVQPRCELRRGEDVVQPQPGLVSRVGVAECDGVQRPIAVEVAGGEQRRQRLAAHVGYLAGRWLA